MQLTQNAQLTPAEQIIELHIALSKKQAEVGTNATRTFIRSRVFIVSILDMIV
jgi:hypothetical protein